MNERELATVLAALRFWQDRGAYERGFFRGIASDQGTLVPLDEEEIDALCEKLNFPATFTVPDQAAACREGWGLFLADDRLEIQRDEGAAIFETNEAALEHVRRKAELGEDLHRRALHLHSAVGDRLPSCALRLLNPS
jgi:hypothetical protein